MRPRQGCVPPPAATPQAARPGDPAPFGAAPLASIDALAVREWLATLAAGGLGPKRAGKARAILSQVLASAVEGGKLSRNVAAGIRPPKVQRAEMCFLDAGQVEALAEAIDPRWATLIWFGATRACDRAS
jgi:site-specific recombinase XerC